MTTKLYVATCEACGSTAAGTERPDRCAYCEVAGNARRGPSLKRWFLICVALGVAAGLLR
jgi:hypothetical protein